MPFSRHWIMHIEASLRIKNKILHSCFTRKRDLKKDLVNGTARECLK